MEQQTTQPSEALFAAIKRIEDLEQALKWIANYAATIDVAASLANEKVKKEWIN